MMRDMHRRINFMKNPRFADNPAFRHLHIPGKQNLTANPNVAFAATPHEVWFHEYAVGSIYEVEVTLQNLNKNSRRLRLLPPTTKFFSVSSIQFPAGDGYVAPGMVAKCVVRFHPDSLGSYEDVLTVHSDLDKFQLPLIAHRRPPALMLPQFMHCGSVLEGNSRMIEFECVNVGGPGRFRVVAEKDFPHNVEPPDEMDFLLLPPFTITPEEFEIPMEHSIKLQVTFLPPKPGPCKREFYLLCDNVQTKKFTLTGMGNGVFVDVCALNGVEFPDEEAKRRSVRFPTQIPGGYTRQTLKVRNDSDVPFHFEWRQYVAPPELVDTTGVPGALPVKARTNMRPRLVNENSQVFWVQPNSGTLAANSETEFVVDFKPLAVEQYQRLMRLFVDIQDHIMSEGGAVECDTQVAEMTWEGIGARADLLVEPSFVDFAGTMLVGQEYTQELELVNPTEVEAHFTFKGMSANLAVDLDVDPLEGVVPPYGRKLCHVRLRSEEIGQLHAEMRCTVLHGPMLPLRVDAKFSGPTVWFQTPCIDFGLVKRDERATCEFMLRNTATTLATWRLKEKPQAAGAAPLLEFSESVGTLQPLAQHCVRAEFFPATIDPLRATVVCSVDGGETTFVTARADVVAPKACLSQTDFSLGICYVDVKIKAKINVQNLTKLPAEFKWDTRLLGAWDEGAMQVSVEPEVMELEPMECVECKVVFWPRKAGIIEGGLIACDVPGMNYPLGFTISADVQNLDVSYEVLPEAEMHRTEGVFEPLTEMGTGRPEEPPVFLDFGVKNVVRQPSRMVLVVRNNTPITTRINLGLEKFGAEFYEDDLASTVATSLPGSPTKSAPSSPTKSIGGNTLSGLSNMSGRTGGSRRKPPRRPALNDRKESLQVFTREQGQTVLKNRHEQLRERRLLASGKGLAVTLDPPVGTIEPYGEFRCVLTALSDMCGDYDDHLQCYVSSDTGELPVKSIPVRVSISGSPLVVQKNRIEPVGMFPCTNQMDLDWGAMVAGAPAARRTFHVQNPTPFDMRLRWKVFNYARQDRPDGPEPWATAALSVRKGRITVSLQLHRVEATEPAEQQYRVEPTEKIIKAGASEQFKVFYQSDAYGTYASVLEGYQHCAHPGSAPLSFKVWDNLKPPTSSDDEESPPPSPAKAATAASSAKAAEKRPAAAPDAAGGPATIAGGAAPGEGAAAAPFGAAAFADGAAAFADGEGAESRGETPASGASRGGGAADEDASTTMGATGAMDMEGMATYNFSTMGATAAATATRPKFRPTREELAAAEKTLVLRGAFHPHAGPPAEAMSPLQVNLETVALKPQLETDQRKEMYFRPFACNPLSHSQYHRSVTLTNLHNTPLTFTLCCKRPWAIQGFEHSVPQAPPLEKPVLTPHGFTSQVHVLPPRENVEVALAFVPSEEVQEIDPNDTEDLHYTSNLVAIFQPLGFEQFLPLRGDYLFPTITVDVTLQSTKSQTTENCLDFGKVHMQAPRLLRLTITNPAVVPAYWKLEGPAEVDGFTVLHTSGTLEGKSLGYPRTAVVDVSFLPPAARYFKRELVFLTKKGRSCSIFVEGEGTVDETLETYHDRPRAWGQGNATKYG